MLSERQLEAVLKVFELRAQDLTDAYLRRIGEHIREIGTATPSDVNRLVELKRMGGNVDRMKAEIAKAMNAAAKDVEKVFYSIAEADYRFAEKFYGEGRQIPIKQNKALLRVLQAQLKQTRDALTNLSRTTVISDAYKGALDVAVHAVQSGVTDYNSAIRGAIKDAAREGLRVEYASGNHRRLDSAVRMNVLDGARQLNQDVARQVGKEYGADGVEISAHALCAEDHLPYQGTQMSNKAYESLQATLARPIGQWNCRHFAFPILLGVSEPTHSAAQLDQYRRNSEERITIGDITKTRYEWSQEQRRIETAIRQQKNVANIAKASGDDALRRTAQYNINQLDDAYAKVSRSAGLIEQRERMGVAGFRKVRALDDQSMKLLQIEQRRMKKLVNDPTLALPQAGKATAAEAKFTRYFFNPENPDGMAKGVAFESRLGYNKGSWEQLRAEILDAAKRFPAKHVGTTPHGDRYEQKVILHGLKGKPENVKVGWIVNRDGVHMTTAFIEEVKGI